MKIKSTKITSLQFLQLIFCFLVLFVTDAMSQVSENWIMRYTRVEGPVPDAGNAIATDVSGNVYVTGREHAGEQEGNIATVMYDTFGTLLWKAAYNGAMDAEDAGVAIQVTGTGDVYVAGYSTGILSAEDYCIIKYDSIGNQIWVNTYNGTGNSVDIPTALTVDPGGNVYVTGASEGAGTDSDIVTIKYDTFGTRLWTARYNNMYDSYDKAAAIAIDAAGNIYVTGFSNMGLNKLDYITIKYDNFGNQLWARGYNGLIDDDDVAADIGIDDYGNVYVTGYTSAYDSLYYYIQEDFLTIKYDSDGNELWTAQYDKYFGPDKAVGLAIDSSGNVFVTGESQLNFYTIQYNPAGSTVWESEYGSYDEQIPRDITLDSAGNACITGYYHSGTGNYQFLTVKVDSGGSVLWAQQYGVPVVRNYKAGALAVDPMDNIYVVGTGDSYGTREDYHTLKYDSAGTELWNRQHNGPGPANGIESAVSMTVDGGGNIYMTGKFIGPEIIESFLATLKCDPSGTLLWIHEYGLPGDSTTPADIDVDTLGNVYVTGTKIDGVRSILVIKYDPYGIELWVREISGSSRSYTVARSLFVDPDGYVYVSGDIDAGSYCDIVTAKYDTHGNLLWKKTYNSPADNLDRASKLTLDSGGNVYVTGTSKLLDGYQYYITIKYDNDGNELWLKTFKFPDDIFALPGDMATDSAGNVYITGYDVDTSMSRNFLTVKYDSSGNLLWSKQYGPSKSGVLSQCHLAIDNLSKVYVAGTLDAGHTDFGTLAYDTDGTLIWVKTWDGARAGDLVQGIVLDPAGFIYVTGSTASALGDANFATIKYDTSGTQIWVHIYDGPVNGTDNSTCIALDKSLNVLLGGASEYAGTGQDMVIINLIEGKYVSCLSNRIFLFVMIILSIIFFFASQESRLYKGK